MAKILIKSGVKPRSLTLVAAIANVSHDYAWDVTITSGNDSKHKKGSKHYTDEAIDIRSKNFPNKRAKQDFMAAVLLRLGPGYDMILESEGQPNEHVHLEWDPK